jgi:N-acetylglutamate synthase-like GNAT family acetyltransferase
MGTTTIPGATLRPARSSDLPAIEQLLTDAGLPLAGVAEGLETFTVAESETELVGVAGLEVCCDNALLRSVAVIPEWRSRGLGRTLVTHVIADAGARGLHSLYLLTTSAERYFPSFGFRPITRDEVPADVRETEEFRTACPASATVMARTLSAR